MTRTSTLRLRSITVKHEHLIAKLRADGLGAMQKALSAYVRAILKRHGWGSEPVVRWHEQDCGCITAWPLLMQPEATFISPVQPGVH